MSCAPHFLPIPGPFDHLQGAEPVLRDQHLNDRLLKDGYVKLPGNFLNAADRDRVRSFFFQSFTGRRSGFHNDFFLPDPQFRRQGAAVMGPVLRHAVHRTFLDLQPFLHTFLTKFATDESTLGEHRDWMYVDELAGHRTYILYVAVDAGDDESGVVHVVPGSHLLPGPPCGTSATWPWLKHRNILRQRAEPIPLRAGEAAVWDNRLIHMSFENRSGLDRVALGAWCHRPGVPLAHFGRFSSGPIDHYRVDSDFFVDETPQRLMNRRPSGYSLVDAVEVSFGRTDAEALVSHLDREPIPDDDATWGVRRTRPSGDSS